MADFKDWFNGIPFFTKWWLSLTLGFSLLGRFGLIKPYYMMLFFEPLFKECQVWYNI